MVNPVTQDLLKRIMDADKPFFHRLEHNGDCLEWGGNRNVEGYGRVSRRAISRHTVLTHRYCYTLVYGPIKDGLIICHTCDNKPCCNPLHLYAGTHMQNTKDRCDRYPRTEEYITSISTKAKLTKKQVLEIRATEAEQHLELAKKHSVSTSTISRVMSRKTYKQF